MFFAGAAATSYLTPALPDWRLIVENPKAILALALPRDSVVKSSRGDVVSARAMPICGQGKRFNCVVDGDTIWVAGEKIRISSIDAPEVHGKCARESDLAARATRRLSALVSQKEFSVQRSGKDRYGRTLALVRTNSGEVGETLVGEGLAQRWAGSKAKWCSA